VPFATFPPVKGAHFCTLATKRYFAKCQTALGRRDDRPARRRTITHRHGRAGACALALGRKAHALLGAKPTHCPIYESLTEDEQLMANILARAIVWEISHEPRDPQMDDPDYCPWCGKVHHGPCDTLQ
jgi:hypothetical protein